MYWCSHVANFPRDGNPIISEDYIAIADEKLLRTVAVDLCNLRKIEPVFDTPQKRIPQILKLTKLDEHPPFEFLHVHPA